MPACDSDWHKSKYPQAWYWLNLSGELRLSNRRVNRHVIVDIYCYPQARVGTETGLQTESGLKVQYLNGHQFVVTTGLWVLYSIWWALFVLCCPESIDVNNVTKIAFDSAPTDAHLRSIEVTRLSKGTLLIKMPPVIDQETISYSNKTFFEYDLFPAAIVCRLLFNHDPRYFAWVQMMKPSLILYIYIYIYMYMYRER